MIAIMSAPAFPSPVNSIAELLNCIRILSRLIPFIFELKDERELENEVFWTKKVCWTNILFAYIIRKLICSERKPLFLDNA